MTVSEKAIRFECKGDTLVGILSQPLQGEIDAGVLVVVGGPQYRVGSHRQFVDLSRILAGNGIACLRFDYRGMGDSEGKARDFTAVEDDIASAIDAFLLHNPGLERIFLWGLCDGATAAAFYAAGDQRVAGLVLLNPWVHTEQAEARVYLRHYYLRRALSGAFWRKLLGGEFDARRSLSDARRLLLRAFSRSPADAQPHADDAAPLPERLRESLAGLDAPVLILLSGHDYVAQEFEDLIATEREWSAVTRKLTIRRQPQADHTFSDPEQSRRAAEMTVAWIGSGKT
jgi:exosortase A-associated hydrolase 1